MCRKLVYLVIVVFVLALGSVAQAGLSDPPLQNPSFESPVLTGWDYYADVWTLGGRGSAYLENGGWFPSSDGINVWKLWSGANVWQQIGTWDPGIDYAVSLWVGRSHDESTLSVELWAGGDPSLVPTGLEDVEGPTGHYGQIDDVNGVGAILIGGADLVPTVEVGQNEWMTAIVNTGTDFNEGDALWLRLVSTAPGGSATYIDNVEVANARDVTFDFDDGTLQGWSNYDGTTGEEFVVLDNWQVRSPNYMVIEADFSDRDSDEFVKVLTSPAFWIGPTTSVEIFAVGGVGGVDVPTWTNYADLPTVATVTDFMGAALRRVRDGEYLLFSRRTQPGEGTGGYEAIGWDAATIAAAVAGDGPGEQYVVDIIDAFTAYGTSPWWAWIGVDDITLTDVEVIYPTMITVPNGDFEQIYQPGSDAITADLGAGWTQGLGPNTPMDNGTATYSDGTTGDSVDILGWIGADPQGWVDNGGTYTRDTSFPNRQGSVARQSDTPDGLYYYLSNGGGWGNPAGGLIVSDAPLATVEGGLTYTLSMLANGGATPVVLELLADGVALTPSSSVDPELSGDWQEFSRTYDAVSLDGHLGESLTICLGVGRGASGGQSHFDAVLLSYVPEPVAAGISLIEDFDSLAVGTNMNDVDGWEGWQGDAQWGARVTDAVAYSGTNSLEIVGGRDDLVPYWPEVTSGDYVLTVMQYVPATTTAGQLYYWCYGLGTVLINCDTGKVYVNDLDAATRVEADLVRDQWVELKIAIYLDIQTCDFYYGDVLLGSRECTSSDGVDIWPTGDVDVIYYDDFRFEPAE